MASLNFKFLNSFNWPYVKFVFLSFFDEYFSWFFIVDVLYILWNLFSCDNYTDISCIIFSVQRYVNLLPGKGLYAREEFIVSPRPNNTQVTLRLYELSF